MIGIKEKFRGRQKTKWRGESISARVYYLMNEMVALHPGVVRLINEVKRLFQRCTDTKKGRAIRIIIESGGGKTHFIRILKMLWPTEQTNEMTRVRIVSFTVPPKPTPDKLTRELLRAMGDPAWNAKTSDFVRACQLIKEIGVYAIAIDNVQDIPEHRGTVGLRTSTNWIRDLIEEAGVLVILLGTSASEAVVISNPQTRRRDPTKFEIPYFNIGEEKNISRFKRFLHEVDDLLPLAEMSGLERYAAQFSWATYGIVDYIFKILEEALVLAIQKGRERIEITDLAQGFDLVFQDAAINLNPFLENGPQRPLVGPGEPFENWENNATIDRTKK